MATLDEGIENLQRFNALLAETNTQVEQTIDNLETQEHDLGQLEEDLETKLDGLQSELQELKSEVEKAEDDASGEIERLGEAAQNAAGGPLEEAENDLDEAEDDVQQKLSKDQGDADKAFATLESDGFEELHGTLQTVGGDVQKSQGEVEQSFDTFDQELQGMQQELEGAGTKAVEGMDQAAEAISGEEAEELKSKVAGYVTAWGQTVPQEVESGADQVVNDLHSNYEGWKSEADADADELMQTVGQLATELAEMLTSELGEQLEQAVDKAKDEAFGTLDDDLGSTNAVLEAGEDTTGELDPLVPELEIAKTVVGEIDTALGALE
jgi:DNA repair exonuclease SbcCD ATPase subunit